MKIWQFQAQDETTDSPGNCRERNRLISTEKGDLYALVDATLKEKLILQCHYCKETDDNRPKIWHYTDVLGKSEPKEVVLDMENDELKNRLQVHPDHSLSISNFTYNDTGVYICKDFEENDTEDKMSYLVDVVEVLNTSNVETGNMTVWMKYHKENMHPINYLFQHSLSPEYVYLREKLNLSLVMKTDWMTWGLCEICGKSVGTRRRKGLCRIKIEHIKEANATLKNFTSDELFLMNADEISCRSYSLKRLAHAVFNSTSIVPDFVELQQCEGICNPDAEGVNSGWKVGKSKSFKYKKTVVMPEGDHLTLVCPESNMENKIVWKRNGRELKRGQSVKPEKSDEEPRILVDTFGTLYLVEVKSSDEGNFTCYVDDIKMEQVVVLIVSKSKILSKLFLRHLIYLGFVLSLTSTCYIGGIIIVCKRRYTFKTYKMLKEEEKDSTDNTDDEEF